MTIGDFKYNTMTGKIGRGKRKRSFLDFANASFYAVACHKANQRRQHSGSSANV